MKHKKISVKSILFIMLFVFATLLLLTTWVLQTVYMEDFYKRIKIKEISNAMKNVVKEIDTKNISNVLDSLSHDYGICTLITDANGRTIKSAEANFQCAIHRWDDIIKDIYISRTNENDGAYMNIINGFGTIKTSVVYEKGNVVINAPDRLDQMPDVSKYQSVVSVKKITNDNGSPRYVFLNSIISPVDATVRTIRVQLLYVSVIIVFVTIILGFIFAKVVSKPIIKLNTSAKKLAKGDFHVKFDSDEYKEVSELSATLNLAAVGLGKTEKLQQDLIANVSHDLRTPLTMIIAYSEVMRDIPGENTGENLQVVIDEAVRLTNLVNDLLDISKMQAGVSTLELRQYNLTTSIQSIIERYAKLVEQNGYKIRFDYKFEVIVTADEFKMYQVLYNLINNAITYTGKDKYVCVKQRIKGDIVRIEVIDTGGGIPKDELENIWQRYDKVSKTHVRAITGTGLGLSIVKSVLEMHDVSYGIDSKLGKGSSFWFELKIDKVVGGDNSGN